MKTILFALLLVPILSIAQKTGKWQIGETIIYRPNDST